MMKNLFYELRKENLFAIITYNYDTKYDGIKAYKWLFDVWK